jgi:hypothetical protein
LRYFFAGNLFLWCVLFVGWVPYLDMRGVADPVSVHVGVILAVTAVLLTAQGILRWRRRQAARVSA